MKCPILVEFFAALEHRDKLGGSCGACFWFARGGDLLNDGVAVGSVEGFEEFLLHQNERLG